MFYKIKSKLKYLIFIIDLIGYIVFSPFYVYNNYFKKIKDSKKILVIKNDFIGDMIIATPFFENLKKNFSSAKITIACRSICKDVLKNNPYVDEIVDLNTPWISRSDEMNYKELANFVKKNFRKYDLVFDLHTEPRNIIIGKLVGKNLIGFGYRGFGFLLTKKAVTDWNNKPMVEQNLDLLEALDLEIKNKNTLLFLTRKEVLEAKKIIEKLNLDKGKKTIGIHPGTSDYKRQWPIKKFRNLIKSLQKDFNIIILENKKELADEVSKDLSVFNLGGELNLREFFAVVSQIDLLIGLESLSVHVAAATKTPVIDIHSSTTNPIVMGPYTNNKIILQKKVKCGCCNKLYCPNNQGIKLIKEEEVKKAVKRILDGP